MGINASYSPYAAVLSPSLEWWRSHACSNEQEEKPHASRSLSLGGGALSRRFVQKEVKKKSHKHPLSWVMVFPLLPLFERNHTILGINLAFLRVVAFASLSFLLQGT